MSLPPTLACAVALSGSRRFPTVRAHGGLHIGTGGAWGFLPWVDHGRTG